MTTDQFWKLIDAAAEEASDTAEQVDLLGESLLSLSASEIASFQKQLWQRLAESYRWDLWAVASIVNGGCSDDGFEYFRGWLIAQGREYFEAALGDPTLAARSAEPDDTECEDILHIAVSAYEEKTGKSMPGSFNPPKEPAGKPWEEDELEALYPALWKRFS